MFGIAYKDENGKDFNGIPWLLDGIDNMQECIGEEQRLIGEGCRDVIPFKFASKRGAQDIYDWNYVQENRIK